MNIFASKNGRMKKKKRWKIMLVAVGLLIVWNHIPYYYSNEKAVAYITSHAGEKSKCCCAGYVMRGLWHGGCPVSLLVLPAYGYAKTLPQMGFKEVPKEGYTPQKGDISVLPNNDKHVFGHIAVYNGTQWVSDFKQNSMLCSKTYRAIGKYQIFRATDGWHWKHVWTTPVDWYGWIEAAIKGWKQIKL